MTAISHTFRVQGLPCYELVIDANMPEGLALEHGVRSTYPSMAIVYTSEAPQKINEHKAAVPA